MDVPELWLLLDSRGMGGIESHVAELAAGLAEAGHRPRVLFLADYGPHPLRQRLSQENVPWECLSGTLIRRLRKGRPAVLHTHGYKANLLGRAAALLTGTRHVASYHAGESPPGRVALWDLADRCTAWMGRRIAVSRPIQARIPFGATYVPNFVALPPQPAAASPNSIGFVGRFSLEKGPDRFVDLSRMVPGPAWLAFGDGPELANCEARGSTSVAFRGAVPSMALHWTELGLLAVTSRAEGLPLAVLEAMAAGVPVAAFALGALPEVIAHGQNGFLVAPDDMDGLAEAVRRWVRMGAAERAALSAAARKTVSRDYGPRAGVARILAVYGVSAGVS